MRGNEIGLARQGGGQELTRDEDETRALHLLTLKYAARRTRPPPAPTHPIEMPHAIGSPRPPRTGFISAGRLLPSESKSNLGRIRRVAIRVLMFRPGLTWLGSCWEAP